MPCMSKAKRPGSAPRKPKAPGAVPHLVKYNAEEVQKAIDRDKTITKKQGRAIHALLKGRH
jgi:hypothetical protein